MLKHCVFLAVRPDAMAGLPETMALLSGLKAKVPGMVDFAQGPNRDFEGLSAGYSYGFVISFADRDAHLAYERHPDHVAAGAALVAACKGGIAGIMVFDLEVAG